MLNTFYRLTAFWVTPCLKSKTGSAVFTCIAAALLCALLFTVAKQAGAENIIIVTASGAAQLSDETLNIKKAATQQALKNAVADVLESVIERERVDVDPTSVETEIYSNAVDFIKNFKVLSEEQTIETIEAPLADTATDEAGINETGIVENDTPEGNVVMPVEVVTYHIWIEAAIDTTSLRKALGKIVFTDNEYETISLVVLDLPNYAAYRSLMTSLERITMIRKINYSSFTANRYAFTLDPTGSIGELMRRVAEEVGSDYVVTGTKNGTIIVKAAPAAISFKEFLESTDAN